MDCPHFTGNDPGAVPFTLDLSRRARRNSNFRTVLWTGEHLQLTVMAIPPWGEIGLEIHPETDQLIRVEQGQAIVQMGQSPEALNIQRRIGPGEAALIPSGHWHNLRNVGNRPLKLSSLYAPPQHPRGTVHRTKEDEA